MMHLLTTTVVALILAFGSASARVHAQAESAATPENAAAFLGEWTISATGQYGPISMTVALKAAEGKVVGQVADQNGKHDLMDVTKAGTSLVLSYEFDYQGMPIAAIVTLTPNEKTVDAALDFAGGAATFAGTATRKQPPA